MGEFIHNARLRNSSMELRAILMRARSEAIHRNLEVQVVPTAGNWRNGWTLQTTDGAQIERFTGLADVTVSPTPAPTVVYRVDGRVRAGAQRIVVSLQDSKVRPRCISISPSGLASTRLDSNFDPADGCT
jgi:Tfp pilus assembly protein FimT